MKPWSFGAILSASLKSACGGSLFRSQERACASGAQRSIIPLLSLVRTSDSLSAMRSFLAAGSSIAPAGILPSGSGFSGLCGRESSS